MPFHNIIEPTNPKKIIYELSGLVFERDHNISTFFAAILHTLFAVISLNLPARPWHYVQADFYDQQFHRTTEIPAGQ